MPRAIIESQIEIDAPPERVWATLVDLGAYASWNPFTPRIDASLRVGDPVLLHVAMRPSRPHLLQTEVCTVNDPERLELGWGLTMLAPFVLFTRRIQRLTPRPDGGTTYYTSDTFEGLLTPIVMFLYRAHIQRGFDAAARALKAFTERPG